MCEFPWVYSCPVSVTRLDFSSSLLSSIFPLVSTTLRFESVTKHLTMDFSGFRGHIQICHHHHLINTSTTTILVVDIITIIKAIFMFDFIPTTITSTKPMFNFSPTSRSLTLAAVLTSLYPDQACQARSRGAFYFVLCFDPEIPNARPQILSKCPQILNSPQYDRGLTTTLQYQDQ